MDENYQIDNEKFGKFVVILRKEKNLTQKELANKLFVSDKTVSKWERGLSIPQVALLIPMANVLGVTVTELLKGERVSQQDKLPIEEVEQLITGSMNINIDYVKQAEEFKKQGKQLFILMLCGVVIEFAIMVQFEFFDISAHYDILIYEIMFLAFGIWACLFVRESLPVYYDQDRISFVVDGFVRINLPGVSFNNSNWKPVIQITRLIILISVWLSPILILLAEKIPDEYSSSLSIIFPVFIFVLILVPIYRIAKKYE